MITNKLCNATKYPVTWNWDKGVNIYIPPDGFVMLTNAQMSDFQPNQPGSEAIQMLMNDYGIFLRDTDRSFESQALEALRACARAKRSQWEESTNNIRRTRADKGIVDNPEALEETFRQLGLVALKARVDSMLHRVKQFEAIVQEQGAQSAVDKIDPDRTLIFTDPPRVFETPFALKVFLSEPENSELREQYTRWRKAQTAE